MTLATIFWSQNYSRKNIWIVSPLQLYCQFIFGYAEFGYSSKNVILGSKWMYRSDALLLLSCIWAEFVHKELHFSAISGRHMEGCYLRARLQIRLTLTLLVFIPWQSHSYADKSVFDTGMFNISDLYELFLCPCATTCLKPEWGIGQNRDSDTLYLIPLYQNV